MTVIVHSYLAAKQAILKLAKDKTFDKYAEQTNSVGKFILTDNYGVPVLPDNASEEEKIICKKIENLNTSIKKTEDQMRKLYRAEYKLMSYATLGLNTSTNGHEKKWAKNNPFAFEAAVLATPVIFTIALPFSLYWAGKETYETLKQENAIKKAKIKTEQEQKAMKEHKQLIAKEGADLESEDLRTVLDIISKSNGIKSRFIENKPDKNAIIMGLALPEKTAFRNRKIKLSDNIYAFYYSKSIDIPYNNHEESDEDRHALLTVFYKNPANGNYHQIAKLVARNSLKVFFDAIEERQKQLEAISAYKQAVNKKFEHIK